MLCPSCAKLAFLSARKGCIRCNAAVTNNLSVLCDGCSSNAKQCAVCLKKIVSAQERNVGRGCGCGKK